MRNRDLVAMLKDGDWLDLLLTVAQDMNNDRARVKATACLSELARSQAAREAMLGDALPILLARLLDNAKVLPIPEEPECSVYAAEALRALGRGEGFPME